MATPAAENSDHVIAMATDADQPEENASHHTSLNHEVADLKLAAVAQEGEVRGRVEEESTGIVKVEVQGIAEEETKDIVKEEVKDVVGEEIRGIVKEEEIQDVAEDESSGIVKEEVRDVVEEERSGIVKKDKEEANRSFSQEEVGGILEVIASTGKFWHDWDRLKSMLSFQLKQVLSEYPEAKMTHEEQIAKLGETYVEMVKRLDEALYSFYEGPPFTLQRLCEILLSARSIYPNLSKLALALEKNLLVTSTLTVCKEPYPQAMPKPDELDKAHEELQLQPITLENGIEPVAGDGDEIMMEVHEAEIDDEMAIDMEVFEDIVGSSGQNSVPISS